MKFSGRKQPKSESQPCGVFVHRREKKNDADDTLDLPRRPSGCGGAMLKNGGHPSDFKKKYCRPIVSGETRRSPKALLKKLPLPDAGKRGASIPDAFSSFKDPGCDPRFWPVFTELHAPRNEKPREVMEQFW